MCCSTCNCGCRKVPQRIPFNTYTGSAPSSFFGTGIPPLVVVSNGRRYRRYRRGRYKIKYRSRY